MKIKTLTSVFVFLLFSTIAQAASNMEMPTNSNQFQVILKANPTTGYQWQVKNYDKSLFKLISSTYQKPNTNLVGAGGKVIFTFQVLKKSNLPSQSTLNFYYARPWEPKAGSSQSVVVTFK